MNKKKHWLVIGLINVILILGIAFWWVGIKEEESKDRQDTYKAIAYVTVPASENWRWIGTDNGEKVISDVDVRYITNIHFAFGMIEAYQFQNDATREPLKAYGIVSQEAYKDPSDGAYGYQVTLQGWIEEMQTTVDGDKYLRALVDLKKKNPNLKISLSIGGWDSDGFCYMAKTPEGRREFSESCIEIIKAYHLDGIDIDWEYPTNGGWGTIAACTSCVTDARLLIVEMRQLLDEAFPNEHKLLSIASGSSQPWVDEETFKALDYMNVMCYDYQPGKGGSQAGLGIAKTAMKQHAKRVGDTPENRKKIHLGVPFYNEGGPYLVPYYKEWNGHVDVSSEIIREKMEWVKKNGYGGAFYWAYSMDVYEEDTDNPADPEIKILQRTLYETLNSTLQK